MIAALDISAGWFALTTLTTLTLGCWIHEHCYQRQRERGRR